MIFGFEKRISSDEVMWSNKPQLEMLAHCICNEAEKALGEEIFDRLRTEEWICASMTRSDKREVVSGDLVLGWRLEFSEVKMKNVVLIDSLERYHLPKPPSWLTKLRNTINHHLGSQGLIQAF